MQKQLATSLRSRYGPFISGRFNTIPAKTAEASVEIPVVNPATGEHISSVISASNEDISEAIEGAHHAFQTGVWSRAPAVHRSKVLSKLARALEERVPDLAQLESLQTGRAIREMNAQLGRLPEWLDYFAALLRTSQGFVAPTQGQLLNYVNRVPLGVVALITPFNHPLLIAIKKIAPALAAGNSVVVKPSELAPVSVLEFAKMATDAGVPPGVLSVLPGYGTTTGKAIISNPLIRKVDITAGTKTGRELGSIVGSNLSAFTAELGGKAPILVFDDADLEAAVNGVSFACFVASGQTCVSGTRVLVHDSLYDAFVEKFKAKAVGIKSRMGDPLNPDSSMGTVISPRHLERIDGMVKNTRGNVICGGERLSGTSSLDGFDFSRGCFYPPTIVTDVDVKDELWEEEVFGPVVTVTPFSTDTQAVMLANLSKYGLGAGIWTSDLSRAHRVAAQIETGLVWVNTHHRNDPSSPWGGMKESGIGRENGIEAYEAYSQSKSIIVNTAEREQLQSEHDWFADSAAQKRYG